MTFRKWNFVFIFLTCLIVSSSFAKNKPQSAVFKSATYTSDKPRQPMDQTFNINNWGFGSADRKILKEMKYKIDSLYEKSTATGNSLSLKFSKIICGLLIKRVDDITRLNVIMLTKYVLFSVCPQDGWVRYGNFSYLIINIRTLKWSDARRTCQMLGGDLAIIKSAAENNFIFTLLKKQKTITGLGVWLGFVRKADNKFYWIDDTPLAKGYTAWASGQPNNVREKCGNMFGSTKGVGGQWNDLFCDNPANHWKVAPVILCKKKQIM